MTNEWSLSYIYFLEIILFKKTVSHIINLNLSPALSSDLNVAE